MTVEEFSNEFDTLLSSYLSYPQTQPAFYLDEYEKSVLLTKAQEDIITSLYNGAGKIGTGFETTEENRSYLRQLITHQMFSPYDAISRSTIEALTNDYYYSWDIPNNLLYITLEQATLKDENLNCGNETQVEVYPITHDEFSRVIKNPFRGPTSLKVIRIDTSNNTFEVISKYKLIHYVVYYLRKPSPIVLVNLGNGLSINGVNTPQTCELHESLHRVILSRAVQLALTTKTLTASANNTDKKQEQ